MNRRLLTAMTMTFLLIVTASVMAKPGVVTPFIEGSILEATQDSGSLLPLIQGKSRDYGIQGAADRMVETQCPGACGGCGWKWGSSPFPCDPPESVPANTLGPAGLGLLHGYVTTDDFSHLVGTFEAADYAICYSYPDQPGNLRIGSHTPFFLYYLTEVMPVAEHYRECATDDFFGKLENGVYGGSADWTTMDYLNYEVTNRPNGMKHYDQFTNMRAAYLIGSEDQWNCWVNFYRDSFEVYEAPGECDMLGIGAGIFSFAWSGIEFDPMAGPFESASNLIEMCEHMNQYQDVTGGFWGAVPPTTTFTLSDTEFCWYSGKSDGMQGTLTKMFTVTDTAINVDVQYNIETDWDFGYIQYSTDGDTWTDLDSFTGRSVGDTWESKSYSFPAAGTYYLRFYMFQDNYWTGQGGPLEPGLYIDNIEVDGVLDTCDTENGWVADYIPVGSPARQETAYCLLALKAVDPWYFADEIAAAEAWLWSNQLPEGGFGSPTNENPQVTAECMFALTVESPKFNDGDANGSLNLTPADAQMAFNIYLGDIEPNWHEFHAADCNADGTVSPADALCIWKSYLGQGCDCVQEIVIPPPVVTKAAEKPSIDGVLTADYSAHGQLVYVEISADALNQVDAFGFNVRIPQGWTYLGADFGDEVSKFDYFAAEPNGRIITVGAFDPSDSIRSSDFQLVTLKFKAEKNESSMVSIENLVDDLANYRIRSEEVGRICVK